MGQFYSQPPCGDLIEIFEHSRKETSKKSPQILQFSSTLSSRTCPLKSLSAHGTLVLVGWGQWWLWSERNKGGFKCRNISACLNPCWIQHQHPTLVHQYIHKQSYFNHESHGDVMIFEVLQKLLLLWKDFYAESSSRGNVLGQKNRVYSMAHITM